MDVELKGKLKNELSRIVNWALEGYRHLRDQRLVHLQRQPVHEKI